MYIIGRTCFDEYFLLHVTKVRLTKLNKATNPNVIKKNAGSKNPDLTSSYLKELNLDIKERYFRKLKLTKQLTSPNG